MSDDNYLTKANWMHRNTKRAYHIVGFSTREEDHCLLVTYTLCDTAAAPVWTRPADEFFDGRFVRLFPGFEDRQ